MPKAAPKRPKITGITLHVLMPDGTTRVHTIDPKTTDALAWSDRAVEVLGKFYDKGGPAEGKQMSREDFLHHFPHGSPIIGAKPHLPMTPAVVKQIWNHPKEDGTTPAFLSKAMVNVVNG
jgi:hypothetical protein